YTFNTASYWRTRSAVGFHTLKPSTARAQKGLAQGNGLFGGPRQVSLRLTASKPSLHRDGLVSAKLSGAFDQLTDAGGKALQTPVYDKGEPDRELAPLTEPVFESSVGAVVEQTAESPQPSAPEVPLGEPVFESLVGPVIEQTAERPEPSAPEVPLGEPVFESSVGPVIEQTAESPQPSAPEVLLGEPIFESSVGPVIEQTAESSRPEGPQTPDVAEVSAISKLGAPFAITPEAPSEVPEAAEKVPLSASAELKSAEPEVAPIEQKQPASSETTSAAIKSPEVEAVTEPAPDLPAAILIEPVFPQTTTPATMPETTQIPIAPASKPPSSAVAKPQAAATTQTSVQLTFSFEIA